MKVLVIPDVHLKPQMFLRAVELMKEYKPGRAVCLMDLPDDWGKEFDIGLYEQTYNAAIAFARVFPNTLWCWGNHDISYVWGKLESGYSPYAESRVITKLEQLRANLKDERNLAFVHRIDNVLFSHGGVLEDYVVSRFAEEDMGDADFVTEIINSYGERALWRDDSPLWARPQFTGEHLYGEGRLLQVVGHTPMKAITQTGSLISCDVFSTGRDGTPYGSGEYLLLDTETWEWRGIR